MPRTRTFLITSYCTYRSHLHNITNPKTMQRSYWIQYQIEPKLISNFTDFNTFSLPTEPLFWTPHLSNTQNDFGAYLIILHINNLHHGTSTFYLFFSIATLALEHGIRSTEPKLQPSDFLVRQYPVRNFSHQNLSHNSIEITSPGLGIPRDYSCDYFYLLWVINSTRTYVWVAVDCGFRESTYRRTQELSFCHNFHFPILDSIWFDAVSYFRLTDSLMKMKWRRSHLPTGSAENLL